MHVATGRSSLGRVRRDDQDMNRATKWGCSRRDVPARGEPPVKKPSVLEGQKG